MKPAGLKVWLIRFLFCVAVIATYKTMDNFSGILNAIGTLMGILAPFLFGGVFAFFLFPPAKKLEHFFYERKNGWVNSKARGLSVLTVVICFLAIVTALLWLLIPLIYNKLSTFIAATPGYINDIYNILQSHVGDAPWLNQMMDSVKSFFSLQNITQSMDFSQYASSLTNVFMTIFNLIIGFIISIYLLLERSKIKKLFTRICRLSLKESKAHRVENLLVRVSRVIYSFVYGQALDALLIGIIVGIVMTIFKIPNALVLGSIYFLFALIPYFGPFIGVASITLLTFLSGGLQTAIVALIIAVILQQVDGNLLYPRVIGSAVGIRPLYVILGVTLFGGLFGFVGLFLGPPLMSILLELTQEFLASKEAAKAKKAKEMQNRQAEV